MATRQQRTLSRRGYDPYRPPLPALIRLVSIRTNGGSGITLTFAQPVTVDGLPTIVSNTLGPATDAVLASPTELNVGFGGVVSGAMVVTLADYDPALRGRNGQWVRGFALAAGTGAPDDLPPLCYIASITAVGAENYQVSLSADAIINPASWSSLIIDGGACSFDSDIAPNAYEVTAPDPGGPGRTWSVAEWSLGGVAGGLWVAPGVGLTL